MAGSGAASATLRKPDERRNPGEPVLVTRSILAILCAALIFTSLTVNRRYLTNIASNRFWTVCQMWQERGFFKSFGLWLEYKDPAFYQQSGPTTLYAYANSDTGFIVPIYLAEQAVTAVRGKPSPVLFQLYSQVVILVGAFFLARLAVRSAIRRGHDVVFAGTLGLAAGLVFQNATYNLHRAREIHHSTVFLTLMIVVLYLRERWFERLKKSDLTAAIVIATLMLWMAVSDHIVNSAFFALAIGLLAFYRVSPPLSLRRWSSLYVLPVLAGEALFQLQLWLGRKYLGIPSLGSPLLLRLGLGDSQFSHAQILTFLRPPWSWWGLAVLATVCLVAVLIVRSLPDDDQNQRDLDPVLSPILVWIFLAAVLSELVSIHPYLYDLFLIIPSILLVFVHGPVLLTRYYAHPGLIALSVLIGATWYVWLSLSAYTRISVPF